MRERANLLISGQVQGVGYRFSTRAEARRLGVDGVVRNLRDGRVEAVVEGERAAIESLIAWCRRGPEGARVDSVEVVWSEDRLEFHGFLIDR